MNSIISVDTQCVTTWLTRFETALAAADLVAQLLGQDVADRVGQIWGLNEQGELSNMFMPTPQK